MYISETRNFNCKKKKRYEISHCVFSHTHISARAHIYNTLYICIYYMCDIRNINYISLLQSVHWCMWIYHYRLLL